MPVETEWQHYDVIVVGAGGAGSAAETEALAATLAPPANVATPAPAILAGIGPLADSLATGPIPTMVVLGGLLEATLPEIPAPVA